MKTYDDIGIQIPQILLPRPGIDLTKWAVIACDQFTSQPEYWAQVEKIVGDSPSTLHLTIPEFFLGKPGMEERIQRAQLKMREYLASNLLEPHDGLVYIERSVAQKTRKGLLLALDLDKYDFHAGSHSLIRATEGTILERVTERMDLREGAALDLPHVMVLIDDPERTIIEPLESAKHSLPRLYDFDLMLDSGHLAGYQVDNQTLEDQIIRALRNLADPELYRNKYHLSENQNVLLFAIGDGNHSLASAKSVWDKMKSPAKRDHPARYALVEIVNLHDPALEFEPIHRVLFGVNQDFHTAMKQYYGEGVAIISCQGRDKMMDSLVQVGRPGHVIGVVNKQGWALVEFTRPTSNLAIGTLQPFLDAFVKQGGVTGIDYIHGADTFFQLCEQPGVVGFYLPVLGKDELFKTVIVDGVLPRKTFSMGEAHEKRFYMESQKIIP